MSLLQEDASKMQLYAYTLPGGHPLPVGSHLLFLCLCSIINWFNEINWEKKIFIYVIKSTEKRKYLIPLIPFHFKKCLRFRLTVGCGSREKTTLITRTSLEILWFRLGWIAIVIYDKELCYCCKIRHFWIILQKSVSFSRTATWLQVLMEWEWSWTSKWKWTKTPSPQINLSVWYLLNPIILEFYKSYSCRCLHLCDSYDL